MDWTEDSTAANCCPRSSTRGEPEACAEVAALHGARQGDNCALLGLVLGQALLVIKPHSRGGRGVLPLGLNTKSASKTSLIIWSP